ncbi:MAG: hypothetical protein EAZ88_23025 [Oscillatoriales cyanobacterium]|nr:MAG: hypothetical protein EAZ88_23025 [Oscillatoriales cyanobacterium]
MKAQSKQQQQCDITIGVDHGSLRLQFPSRHSPLWEALDGKLLKGKPKYLPLGRHGYKDNPEDWKRASALAAQMEADLDHPEWEKLFDPTLAKYGLGGGKYAKLADVLQMPGVQAATPEITVGEMWEVYLQWKQTTIEETTFKAQYVSQFSNAIEGKTFNQNTKDFSINSNNLSSKSLSNVTGIREVANSISMSKKQYLQNELYKAFDFCKSKGILQSTTENPFVLDKYSAPAITTQQKYASKIVNGEEKEWHEITDEKGLEGDRRAFTKVERDTIIKAFYESNSASVKYVAPLIEFYFLTGCRTSEAFALNWGDINFERNVIRFSKSLGASTRKLKETKTGETRLFYFKEDSRLKRLLISLKSVATRDLVFPGKNGSYLSNGNLSGAWQGQTSSKTNSDGTKRKYYYPGIVSQLAADGKISGYLSPYHTRHTYITLTAHANAHNNNALLHIATACGNSVDVILRHYLGVSESVELTEV